MNICVKRQVIDRGCGNTGVLNGTTLRKNFLMVSCPAGALKSKMAKDICLFRRNGTKPIANSLERSKKIDDNLQPAERNKNFYLFGNAVSLHSVPFRRKRLVTDSENIRMFGYAPKMLKKTFVATR
uniref:Uncharacterized protein n=1 Tax=Romanomermis culicivorax TaxID=13658 RepID=A0A915KWX9_ROMCU